jgi:accessory colonization factor AcfC
VYSRAGLSRTVTLVVALSLTAVSTSAVARAFDAADTTGEDLNRSNVAVALIGPCVPANVLADAAPVSHHRTAAKVTAASGSSPRWREFTQKMPRGPTMARLIERIRKVE